MLVGGRHWLFLERYDELRGLGDFNDAWLEAAVPMATEAVEALLNDAGIDASEIDAIAGTTVTGLAVPSLDAA